MSYDMAVSFNYILNSIYLGPRYLPIFQSNLLEIMQKWK